MLTIISSIGKSDHARCANGNNELHCIRKSSGYGNRLPNHGDRSRI